ncbi:MAG TPA: hypothetical protein VNH84_15530, partial [Candidatus Saccharimonadales bacterium]|nr:hypothetical protein [Candidatus Saccharimonadales bacterium]
GDGQLNGVGQDARGAAFLAVAVLRRAAQSNQVYATALRKDGERLICTGKSSGGGVNDDSVLAERLLFDAPLNDIAYFKLGAREMETMEWTNVALPSR